jgi:CRISPR-associated protein Cmr3
MPARQDQDAGGLKWVEGNDGVTLEYEVDGRALPSAALENYLLAKEPYLEALSSYFEIDRRVGIERSQQSFTAEEGRLYTAEFIRPSNSSFFVVEVREDSDELPTGPAVVAIGGERRPFEVRADAGVKPIAHATRAAVERELLQRAQTTGRFEFRLYVLSPTPPGPDAKNGWIPHLPTIEGVHLRVMAAAVPRCIWLSGWRVARREPRAARPHIAAGAVYFVRAEFDGLAIEEVVRLVMEKFWYQATLCAEDDKIEERAGHGVTLVGVIPDVH